jgi:hypothetical protein
VIIGRNLPGGARRRPRRTLIAGVVAVVVAVAATVGVVLSGAGMTPGPVSTPSATPGTVLAPDGPTVWGSVRDSRSLSLWRRRLDGQSPAVKVATRPAAADGGDQFIVGPGGAAILYLETPESGVWTLSGIGTATGATTWSVQVDTIVAPLAVWSPDGQTWVALTADPDRPAAILVDVRSGAARRFEVPASASLQGFTSSGGQVVLRSERTASTGDVIGFDFAVLDPDTGDIEPVDPAAVRSGPNSALELDVAPNSGLAVVHVPIVPADGTDVPAGENIVLIDLRTGARRPVAHLDRSVLAVRFTPAGDGILVFDLGPEDIGSNVAELRLMGIDGSDRQLWRGAGVPDGPPVVSSDGQVAGFAHRTDEAVLTVVVLGDTRNTDLPLPAGAMDAALLGIDAKGVPANPMLPQIAAASPGPRVSAKPIAGAPRLVGAWLDREPDGTQQLRVERIAPTSGGRFTTADEMPPILFAADEPDLSVQLLPNPRNGKVLVAVSDDEQTRLWLWTPGEDRTAFASPAGWPLRVGQLRWRPDGRALLASDAGVSDLVLADRATGSVHRMKLDARYSDIVGWTADGRSVIAERSSCTDGCPGTFAEFATLRLSDGRVRPFPANSAINARGGNGASVRSGAEVSVVNSALQVVPGQGPGYKAFAVEWPASAGEPQIAGPFSPDGRILYVTTDAGEGAAVWALMAIAPPARGALLRPERIGTLPSSLSLTSLDPSRRWALGSVEAPDCYRIEVVELASGDPYTGDCAVAVDWLPRAPAP